MIFVRVNVYIYIAKFLFKKEELKPPVVSILSRNEDG